ncbi:MAG: DNA oxidative demethylase AlkB [Acetobacteraceae bacterium]
MIATDLFAGMGAPSQGAAPLAEGAMLLRGFAVAEASDLMSALKEVLAAAPFHHMLTPGGHRMSVAMSNCGPLGWVTDRRGYRYVERDPETERPWPAMPTGFAALAARSADAAGFGPFFPDCCLINRYHPGARMALHQDRDERDFAQPIVSVSLGLPARFLFGGLSRREPSLSIRLEHGDVVVWGGPMRLAFHGIAALADGVHPLTGSARINLTFRKAG